MWFVYMVETACGQLYTGIATDVERRFSEHLASYEGRSGKGAKYFRGRKPIKVVYQEEFETRSAASKREYEIKQMGKSQKAQLLEEGIS